MQLEMTRIGTFGSLAGYGKYKLKSLIFLTYIVITESERLRDGGVSSTSVCPTAPHGFSTYNNTQYLCRYTMYGHVI